MNVALLSRSYNEVVNNLNLAYQNGDMVQVKELVQRAIDIASQIAFSPNVMAQVADYYRQEVEKLRNIKLQPAPAPAGGSGSSGAPAAPREAEADTDAPADPDLPPPMTVEEAKAELESLIGLARVKQQVHNITCTIMAAERRRAAGLKNVDMTNHLVFRGNPGTGKTTVARLVAQIYRALGVLEKGHLVEVSRAELVAEYEGHTAIKTRKVIQSAMGGILFIDEAYTLVRDEKDPFGHEAVDTLLKYLEDHRKDFVVIVAGYSDQMDDFLAANPGLASRFKNDIDFEDYTGDELVQIFDLHCRKSEYMLSDDARRALLILIDQIYQNRSGHFGNGRQMRNLLEDLITNQNRRLFGGNQAGEVTTQMLQTIEACDIPTDYRRYI